MGSPCASLVLILCIVRLSNQTTTNGIEESIKDLSNLILGKWADLEYKMSVMDTKLRQIDTTINNDIKKQINEIVNKVEVGGCGQNAPINKDSEDPINEIKSKTIEIAEEVKQMKRESTFINTVVNSLTLTSNSMSTKLENIERELTNGIEEIKTPLQEIILTNENKDTCAATIDNITRSQVDIRKGINTTLEEIISLKAEKSLLTSTPDDLILNGTVVRNQLENIQRILNDSVVTIKKNFESCPDGFLTVGSPRRCFKVYPHQKLVWEDAKDKCIQEGLQLPEHTHHVIDELMRDIKQRYGNLRYVWIGARGDGNNLVWDQSRTIVSINTDNMWLDKNNPSDTSRCLLLDLNRRPYDIDPCINGLSFICEMIRE